MKSILRRSTQRRVYTSTTGFQNALGESTALYIGGTLDAKVKNQISSLAQSGIMYASNGGPGYGVLWMKVSASYYSGILFTYYGDDVLYQFTYAGGTYRVVLHR